MSISQIPQEILDLILSHLDLPSIKALRLTNRSFSTACVGKSFLSFFKQPETDLSDESLACLDALARKPILQQHCHTLVIFAFYYDPTGVEKIIERGRETGFTDIDDSLSIPWSRECSKEELAEAAREVAWMKAQHEAQQTRSATDAIRTLTSILSRFSSFDTIRLDAVGLQSRNFDLELDNSSLLPLWAQASWVHDVAMAAINQSRVVVRKLDVYRTTPRCGIACSDYGRPFAGAGANDLAVVGANLDAVSLSWSTDIDEETVKRFTFKEKPFTNTTSVLGRWLTVQADRRDTSSDPPDIIRMLQNCPRLSRLDLHLYHLTHNNLERYDWIFDSIATHICLSELQHCKLSGLMATEKSLLSFLEHHPRLRSLSLRGLYLTEGTWTPILTQLSSRMPKLELLELSCLWWQDRKNDQGPDTAQVSTTIQMLNLDPTWDMQTHEADDYDENPTGYLCTSGEYVVHTRLFEKEDLQQRLRFRQMPISEAAFIMDWRDWARKRRAEYGPPYDESGWSYRYG